jgi:hypothetical protein
VGALQSMLLPACFAASPHSFSRKPANAAAFAELHEWLACPNQQCSVARVACRPIRSLEAALVLSWPITDMSV